MSVEFNLEFVMWLTGHDKETILQMHNDWQKSPSQLKSMTEIQNEWDAFIGKVSSVVSNKTLSRDERLIWGYINELDKNLTKLIRGY